MPGGRPTKYDPKFIEKVDEYLKLRQDEKEQVVKYEGEKSTGYETKLKVALPTLDGFAMFIGVPRSTLYDWKATHKEFSDSLEKIVSVQKKRLLDSGLSGDYNSTIAKLILSSNHGMAEKQQLDHTTQGEKIVAQRTPKEEAEIDEAQQAAADAYLKARRKQLMRKPKRK